MNKTKQKKEIIIYKGERSEIKIKALLEDETIWLSQKQMANIFKVDVRTVNEHLQNIFSTGELNKNSVIRKFRTTASDGKKYQTQFYNLDVIISVGYRVNSKKATQFRVWATRILRGHILDGYTINENVLSGQAQSLRKLQKTINFLNDKVKKKQLVGQEKEILGLLSDYSRTLSILEKYDKNKLDKIKGRKESFTLGYKHCLNIIKSVKKDLIFKKEATDIFGNEIDHGFEAVINNLYQTFNKKNLYFGIEPKASHLFYFIIKDHPFSDGNKRIGSFLFVYFLDKNNYLYKKKGGVKISDSALTALALLVAESRPGEKDVMISLIENLTLDK
ncbi:virulence RhuM family protein [bacterium]|nr:virulence RhuM family protein [bacterium]